MRKSVLAFLFATAIVIFYACHKKDADAGNCFPNASTYRQIIDKPATVKQQAGGTFYLVEESSIDTKLNPCNLPVEFQVNDLQVTFSGEVKTTLRSNTAPCCAENFVITKITR